MQKNHSDVIIKQHLNVMKFILLNNKVNSWTNGIYADAIFNASVGQIRVYVFIY